MDSNELIMKLDAIFEDAKKENQNIAGFIMIFDENNMASRMSGDAIKVMGFISYCLANLAVTLQGGTLQLKLNESIQILKDKSNANT